MSNLTRSFRKVTKAKFNSITIWNRWSLFFVDMEEDMLATYVSSLVTSILRHWHLKSYTEEEMFEYQQNLNYKL